MPKRPTKEEWQRVMSTAIAKRERHNVLVAAFAMSEWRLAAFGLVDLPDDLAAPAVFADTTVPLSAMHEFIESLGALEWDALRDAVPEDVYGRFAALYPSVSAPLFLGVLIVLTMAMATLTSAFAGGRPDEDDNTTPPDFKH